MAELASAPAERRRRLARLGVRASPWSLLVAASLLVVLGGTAAFGAAWIASSRTARDSYGVRGPLMGVQVRVASGDVTILGGAQWGVTVWHDDRSTFGHGPVEWREQVDGRLTIASACPKLVAGSCSASYRLAVPDNVPVSVRADDGDIAVEGYRGSASLATGGGSISVDAFCGHTLRATSVSGTIGATVSCSPERLELRSTSGDVAATVPPGRYRVEAATATGAALVRGIVDDPNAPWEIQALSTSGDVSVEVSAEAGS